MSEYLFYRCGSCGRLLKNKWIERAAKKGGKLCPCGGTRCSPTNLCWWKEVIFLVFHPWMITKTILWPSNWVNWKKFLIGGEE